MLSNKLACLLLVISIVVCLYTLGATVQAQTGESVEASDKNNKSEETDASGGKEPESADPPHDAKKPGVPPANNTNNIPSLSKAGKQLELIELKPKCGMEGDKITIVGKNFGTNRTNITVVLETQEFKGESPRLIALYDPDTQNQNQQELKFDIPATKDLLSGHWLTNKVNLHVEVNDLKSDDLNLSIVPTNWRSKVALLALIPIVILLILLKVVVVKWEFLKAMFIDKQTNTYSLSKCQAFTWTVILIWSYLYLVIGTGLIIGKRTIPDFNLSLVCLMGVSYFGLLAAQGVNKPKNDLKDTPLQLSSLFSEGGEVSLSRFQLVGFTITAIFVYLYYLYDPQILINGLPEIPTTLVGLLGISQGGYIGGKVVGEHMAVNNVRPRRIQKGKKDVELTLMGAGFIANTKVLLQDYPQLIDTQLTNRSILSLKLPKLDQIGGKQLVVVPPTGNSFIIDDVFEVVDPIIEKIECVSGNPKQVKLTLKGFNLKEIQPTIDGKLATTVSMTNNTLLTLEAEADIKTSDIIKITSVDGQLEVEKKIVLS